MALYTNDFGTYFDDRLLQCIKRRENEEVRLILRKTNDLRYSTSSSAATLLHYAAEYGNEEITQYLLELGSNVNAQNQLKETPLLLALEGGFKRTISILLHADADVHIPDIYGKSALCRLFDETKRVNETIVRMFLDRVAVDPRGDQFIATQLFDVGCPLYRAVRLKKWQVTRLLLDKGSPVEAREPRSDRTALHIAVEQLDVDNVRVLLEHNADVNAKDCNGMTPLSLVPNVLKVMDIIKTLLARGSVLLDSDCAALPLLPVLAYGNGQAIRTFLHNNVDIYAIFKAIVNSFLRLYHHVRTLLCSDATTKKKGTVLE